MRLEMWVAWVLPLVMLFGCKGTNDVGNAIRLTALDDQVIALKNVPLKIQLRGSRPPGLEDASYYIAEQPQTGALSELDAANGTVTYTPANIPGKDAFKFMLSNGTSSSNLATVNVQVNSAATNMLLLTGSTVLVAGRCVAFTVTRVGAIEAFAATVLSVTLGPTLARFSNSDCTQTGATTIAANQDSTTFWLRGTVATPSISVKIQDGNGVFAAYEGTLSVVADAGSAVYRVYGPTSLKRGLPSDFSFKREDAYGNALPFNPSAWNFAYVRVVEGSFWQSPETFASSLNDNRAMGAGLGIHCGNAPFCRSTTTAPSDGAVVVHLTIDPGAAMRSAQVFIGMSGYVEGPVLAGTEPIPIGD